MRGSRAASGVVALLVLIAVAACARPDSGLRAPAPGRSTISGVPASELPAPTATTIAPEAVAQQDAQALLTSLDAPKGWVLLPALPPSAKILASPGEVPSTPNLIDDTAYWSAPGPDDQAVLAAVPTPTGAQMSGKSSTGGPDGSADGVVFSWPATSVLDLREVEVEASAVGGKVVVRADAIVTYLPSRPPDSMIPETATAVAAVYQPGGTMVNGVRPTVPPESSGDPAVVSSIVASINAAPMQQLGPHSCPASRGEQLSLTFRHGAGGPAVATAVIDIDGCPGIHVSVVGGGTAYLNGPDVTAVVMASLHMSLPYTTALSTPPTA